MDKKEFLNILRQDIKNMPKSEITKTLNYYEELIDDKVEDTKLSESEVIKTLEHPSIIAKNILNEEKFNNKNSNAIEENSTTKPKVNIALFVILIIFASPFIIAFASVIFALYVTLVSLVLAIVIIAFSLFIVSISLLLYGVVSITYGALNLDFALINLFYGLVCFGIGLITVLPTYKFMLFIAKNGFKFSVQCFKLIFKFKRSK